MAKLEVGVEIERKYIIRMPSVEDMMKMDRYEVSDIVQTYIASAPGVTRRVRMRRYGESVKYFETRKTRIDKMSSVEEEGELSRTEYELLLSEMLDGTTPIKKKRHTFIYKNQTFEVDVYPNWRNTAVMETELSSRDVTPEIPGFIEIIKDVTGDRRYSNASMSRAFPNELI